MPLDFKPTVHAEHVSPGMVIDFEGDLGELMAREISVSIFEAEVVDVEEPDGLGERSFWVRPVDGEHVEVFVWADPDRQYAIVG